MKINSDLLANFTAAVLVAKDAKAAEAKLRQQICDELLEGKVEGTHTFNIDGFKIKATKKITYSLDKEILAELYPNFDEDERACISYNPAFVKSAYQRLPHPDLMNSILITKPAMPSLVVTIEEGES